MIKPNQTKFDLELDQRGDGLYSGTFRWSKSKSFAPLPPCNDIELDISKGWREFLQSRGSTNRDLVQIAMSDPAFIDALSFPLTIANLLRLLNPKELQDTTPLQIVILGASMKAEQRIWENTNYWYELCQFYPGRTITIWFVGPEVSCTLRPSEYDELKVHSFKGTCGEFLKSKEIENNITLCVGFNTGFGNFIESQRFDLLESWLPDLYMLSILDIPVAFTCANDYADVNGEFIIQSKVIGSEFLILPKENPFSAASHLHSEGKRDTSWSRANSFLYVVKGYTCARRKLISLNQDKNRLKNTISSVMSEGEIPLIKDSLDRVFYKGRVVPSYEFKETIAGNKNLKEEESPSESRIVESPQNPLADPILPLQYQMVHDNSRTKISICLPGVTSMKHVKVEVSLQRLVITSTEKIEIPLPHSVKNSKVMARFNSKTSMLKVLLPHL